MAKRKETITAADVGTVEDILGADATENPAPEQPYGTVPADAEVNKMDGSQDADTTEDAAASMDGVDDKPDAVQDSSISAVPDATQSEPDAPQARYENLSTLADRHRIPAWQQAALLRYMGWQDDKMVTDQDYKNALEELRHRRIGGGRK